MKKVIWSLCCLCLTTLASAQPFPQQEIRRIIGNTDANKIETVKQLVQLPDGYLLLAGTWQDSAFVMKVNEVGDKIWHRTFNPGTKSTFAGVVSLSNGDIIALGSCDSCLGNE